MSVPFVTIRRIEFAETDMAGIVHFANFFRYMEQAEHEFFRSLGFSIIQKQDDGAQLTWPRVAAECSYSSPAYYEDELEIAVSIARKGLRSLTLNYEFRRGDTRIARGEMKIVCCLLRHGAPLQSIDIPPAMNEAFEAVMQAGSKSP